MKQFVLMLTILVLALLIWSQFESTPAQATGARIIAVEGAGEIEVTPDLIQIHYTLSQRHDSDVAVAKADVDQRASDSVQALIELGVDEADVSSSSLRIDTVENFHDREGPRSPQHRVTRQIELTLRDVTLYNRVLQALVDSRISEITMVKPDVSNEEELKRQALASAAADATAQARFLAGQFDAEVDRIHQIGRQNVQRHFDMQEVAAFSARGTPKATVKPYEFKPGKVKVSSNVYVEFELQ